MSLGVSAFLQIPLIIISLVHTCGLNMNVENGTLKISFLIGYCFSVSLSDGMCRADTT